MPKAIIVGAGVAAASAATRLVAAGWRVRILDKAAQPGGRCATRRSAINATGAWFDYGAQYFTARDPVFRTIVEADVAAGRLVRWHPDIQIAEHTDKGWQRKPSPDTRERLIGADGLNAWINARLTDSGASVRCDARVASVTSQSGRWRVTLAEGKCRYADAMVITTPAPQAATLLGQRAQDVGTLTDAANAMRACYSLVAEAPALPRCHALFVKHGVLSWLADNSHKAGQAGIGRHLWTLHATPEFSDAHIDAAPDRVQRILIEAFAAIAVVPTGTIVPVHFHRWRHARPGAGALGTADPGFADAGHGLVLAGDWLAGGRVEGAWLSGHAAARALIRR